MKSPDFLALKAKTDIAQVFLVFMATVGDVDKTALALDIDPVFVAWLAEQEGWKEKVRRISIMSKGGKPGDWERAQNRALNFVQAHRVRMLIDRLLLSLIKMDEASFLKNFQTVVEKNRNSTSARFFADVMSALEKVHTLSYYALGDSVGERMQRSEQEGGDRSAADIHAALIAALNNPMVSHSSTEVLVEEAAKAITAGTPERNERQNDTVNGSPGEVSEHLPTVPTCPLPSVTK